MRSKNLKYAFVTCNGCPENLFDSERVRKYLVQNGWHITDQLENAELILFNSCGLTKTAEISALKIIEDLINRSKKGSRLFVWGCLPKIHPEALKQVYNGPFLGERELFSQIDEITKANSPIESITNNQVCQRYPSLENNWRKKMGSWVFRRDCANENQVNLYRGGDNSIFYIKTSSGCLGHCTYCAVRISRGTVRSKSIESIVREFRSGLNMGYKEFSLLGTDLGCQGIDLRYNLCDLLNELIKHEGDYKIGIRNINPAFMKELIDDLEPLLKTGRIWYLGMPAESGSNRILKLMGRKYYVEEYIDYFKRIKIAYDDIKIRNQMLVGFPSETERDFAASMKLIDDLNFDHNEIYSYSRRPGTAADEMNFQVPHYVIRSRAYRMQAKLMLKGYIKNRRPKHLPECIEARYKKSSNESAKPFRAY
jgi:threonylcarbamoyladenosine tRNA methylthiotransferase CDKAL1